MIRRSLKQRDFETFLVELIKPSHYDDDGYVIQWWRGLVPSNSLSVLMVWHRIRGSAAFSR